MGKFHLFFGLHLGHRLYSHTDNLLISLLSEKMSAASSKRLANLTVSLFQLLRVEESFKSYYNAVLKKMKTLAFISESKLLCKCRAPDYSIINPFSSSNKQSSVYYLNTPRDDYRVIYYEVLDLITSLKERFDNPALKLMKI